MSKRVFLGAAAAAISAFAGPALAQDVYDWTGFYIGANAGMNWGDANNETVLATGNGPVVIDPDDLNLINNGLNDESENGGFTGGVQAGYNWQNGGFVFGVETDIGVLALDQDNVQTFTSTVVINPPINPPVQFTIGQKVSSDWMWTLRPRVGWAGGPWMLYVTGGLAVANIKLETSFIDTAVPVHAAVLENDETRAGWVLGVGGAWAFSENWSVGAEWLYADFGTVDATAVSNNGFAALFTETNPRANILRGRVDFKF